MRLYQYWDTGSPPDDVARWVAGFKAMNPEMKHRLYDRGSASWFVRKHLGEREQGAFEACAVPAMQADYFRLCALVAKGGLYLDVDFAPLKPLDGLLALAPEGLMPRWDGYLQNSVLYARRPGHPFFSACLALATSNIEQRRFSEREALLAVASVAGPDVPTALWALIEPETQLRRWSNPDLMEVAAREVPVTETLRQSFANLSRPKMKRLYEWLGVVWPAYHNGDSHWLGWNGPIYTAPAKVGAN